MNAALKQAFSYGIIFSVALTLFAIISGKNFDILSSLTAFAVGWAGGFILSFWDRLFEKSYSSLDRSVTKAEYKKKKRAERMNKNEK